MKHVGDGELRRYNDEPGSIGLASTGHIAACQGCRDKAEAFAVNGKLASAFFPPSEGAKPDAAAAHAAFLATVQTRGNLGRWEKIVSGARRRQSKFVTASAFAIAAVAAGALVVSGAAQGVISVFEPKTTAPITVTSSSVKGFPDLSAYGDLKAVKEPVFTAAADAGAAASATGTPLRAPSKLPPGLTGAVSYAYISEAEGTFTFSKAKAEAAAKKEGKPLPKLPPGADGTVLTFAEKGAAIALYGRQATGERGGMAGKLPQLAVVIAHTPTVTSNGATVPEIEAWLASMPGISPDLAAQIKSLGRPGSTLPIPVPGDVATGKQVKVDGVTGTLIGDNTGLGAAVIWQKGGYLYAIGGTQTESDVLTAANSMK